MIKKEEKKVLSNDPKTYSLGQHGRMYYFPSINQKYLTCFPAWYLLKVIKYYGCLESNFLEDRGPATKAVATHKAQPLAGRHMTLHGTNISTWSEEDY